MTRRHLAAVLLLLPVLAACSSATPAPAPPPAAVGLTGFGATQANWDAHHTADPDKATGFYNPDPALPQTKDGKVNDTYDSVTADAGGHVQSYFLAFTGRPVAAALDRVKQELPADTQFSTPVPTSGIADSKCLIFTATSATVGKVMGGANGSAVTVELQSWSATNLDQNAIAAATLVSAGQANAGGC